MSVFSLKRLGVAAVGAIAAMTAAALPAGALGINLGGSGSLLHLQDCRSLALTRQMPYDIDFSSNTTGPQHVHVGVYANGSITLCWDVDVSNLGAVQVDSWTDLSGNTVVASLLGETDASRVCTAIRLVVGPNAHALVSAKSHADVVMDGTPVPIEWDHVFAKDTTVSGLGEDIVLKACFDTNGGVSAS